VSGAALALGGLTACSNDSGGSNTAATSASEAPASSSAATSSSAGGGDSTQTGSITATEADFSISLDKDTLSAGTYEIKVVNDGGATHDLVVEQNGNDVAGTDGTVAPGDSTTFTVTLDPGDYVFYCSIGNHRQMGMELTVRVT
jgi:plastocyanin